MGQDDMFLAGVCGGTLHVFIRRKLGTLGGGIQLQPTGGVGVLQAYSRTRANEVLLVYEALS
jgi:hypothetical protein